MARMKAMGLAGSRYGAAGDGWRRLTDVKPRYRRATKKVNAVRPFSPAGLFSSVGRRRADSRIRRRKQQAVSAKCLRQDQEAGQSR